MTLVPQRHPTTFRSAIFVPNKQVGLSGTAAILALLECATCNQGTTFLGSRKTLLVTTNLAALQRLPDTSFFGRASCDYAHVHSSWWLQLVADR